MLLTGIKPDSFRLRNYIYVTDVVFFTGNIVVFGAHVLWRSGIEVSELPNNENLLLGCHGQLYANYFNIL